MRFSPFETLLTYSCMFQVISICCESVYQPTDTRGIYTSYGGMIVDITDGTSWYASGGHTTHRPRRRNTTLYGISCDDNRVATLESYIDGAICHSCLIADYPSGGWTFTRRPCPVEYDDGEVCVLYDSGRRIMIRYDKI